MPAPLGLFDAVIATGAPPIRTVSTDFGGRVLAGAVPTNADLPAAIGPRRITLDELLLSEAVVAGAELREAFTVDDLVFDEGRVIGIRGYERNSRSIIEHAPVRHRRRRPQFHRREARAGSKLPDAADAGALVLRLLARRARGRLSPGR